MTGKRGTQRILAIATLALFSAVGSAQATLMGDVLDFASSLGNQSGIAVLLGQVEFDRFGNGAAFDCDPMTPAPDAGMCNFTGVDLIDLQDDVIVLGLGEVGPGDFFHFFSIRDPILLPILTTFVPDTFTADVLLLSGNEILVEDPRDIQSGGSITDGTIQMSLTFAPPGTAPEPSTLLLLGAGLLGLWARRRRI